MHAHFPHAVPDHAGIVYAKTAKGRDEIALRRGGLNSRQRSILILLDGRKHAASFIGLMPAEQVQTILGELSALELIAPAATGMPAPVLPAPAPAPTPAIDPGLLAPVKAMMTRTATTSLGPMAAELIRQINAASDETGIQRAVAHWHMAMQDSKYGRQVAEEQLALIKASLQELFV